jgi:hypothetical protein
MARSCNSQADAPAWRAAIILSGSTCTSRGYENPASLGAHERRPLPPWERHGPVSRFYLGLGLPLYEVEERALLGGALFVASAVDTAELIGQFESEHNARQACARDYALRAKAGRATHRPKGG